MERTGAGTIHANECLQALLDLSGLSAPPPALAAVRGQEGSCLPASRAARASPSSRSLLRFRRRVLEEIVGVEVGAILPHQPESFEDLALSVEPAVAGGASALFTGKVEAADDIALLAGPDAGAPGVVGHVLEFGVTARVESLVTERFAVAAAIGDTQAAEAPNLAGFLEAVGIFNERTEDRGADLTNPRHFLEACDLWEGAAEAVDLVELFGPEAEGGVEEFVGGQQTVLADLGNHLDPTLALLGVEEFLATQLEDAEAAVAVLDESLQLALLITHLEQIVDGLAEDLALFIIAHPDLLEFAEAQKAAEIFGVDLVVLVGIAGDESITARIANDEAGHEGSQDPGGPPGQGSGFDCELDFFRLQSADVLAQVALTGVEAFATEQLSVLAHPPENRSSGVQVNC